jgi:flagellin-specific chaperone FliS
MELSRAEAVISHLEHTLDAQPGNAARNMVSIYGFCRGALGRARRRRDPGALDEVIRILRQMRPTWESIRAA